MPSFYLSNCVAIGEWLLTQRKREISDVSLYVENEADSWWQAPLQKYDWFLRGESSPTQILLFLKWFDVGASDLVPERPVYVNESDKIENLKSIIASIQRTQYPEIPGPPSEIWDDPDLIVYFYEELCPGEINFLSSNQNFKEVDLEMATSSAICMNLGTLLKKDGSGRLEKTLSLIFIVLSTIASR